MNENRRRLLWLQLLAALAVFAVVVGLALYYQDSLKEIILIPLLYVTWVTELVLKSFDQRCIWLMALVVAVSLSVAFSRRSRSPVEFYQRSVSPNFPESGRIRYWKRQIRIGSGALYTSGFHRSELSRLVIETLAYREGVSAEEIREQLNVGVIAVPSEVRTILGLDELQDQPEKPSGFMKRTTRWFNQFFRQLFAPKFTPKPRLEKVVEYLESLMEVDDDAGNR
ncbi:MAG: hypothetical protein ACK2U1_26030 [Anaerolineales bacterium]|jgi:hypothetical protein